MNADANNARLIFNPPKKEKEKKGKHAKLGAILKVRGGFGGLGEKCFYFAAVSQEGTT